MAIYLVSGVPGSGKTLFTIAKFILPALHQGRHIYSNIDGLKPSMIAECENLVDVTIERLFHYIPPTDFDSVKKLLTKQNDCPLGSLLIVDEAQNYFNSRDFKEQANKMIIPYLTEHRHYGHDVVAVSQNIDSIDITFRRLAELTYKLTNLSHYGMSSRAKYKVWEGGTTEFSPLATKMFSYPKHIFKYYSSYVSSTVKEKKKKIFIPKSLLIFLVVIFLFLFVKYRYDSNGGSLFSKTGVMYQSHKQQELVNVSSSSSFSRGIDSVDTTLICFGGFCRKQR